MDLNNYIRDIPDFPKKGILYKDITTLLKDKTAFSETLNQLHIRHKNNNISKVVGIEARGFIFGSSLATKLGCGFVPIRKPNKLPYKTYNQSYSLEYGTDIMEIHIDAIDKNDNIILVDDVLATGGTAFAAIELLERFNCNLLECLFILEISELKGAKKILNKNKKYFSLIKS
ncbi:MAG: Adenine phosphoribosyltransferase [Alphaproteobacteria bacterium MarineAlpha9_Bin4]|nr:adenine phosphoribosyltransferase [Pelagibacterales bacterium]PPR25906.1 MAG: Adenine phosphoribosyltransferase [Alphaproteobacteria bacterium MarineAlpha9_Bin4]|tara:strand:- start:221 stop:739 length:519 start_codon:yes stop_codon:yes gene_type:complete